MQKIRLVLPAYNEALNIPRLFTRIDALVKACPWIHLSVLLVNDGSTDQTLNVAKTTPLSVPLEVLNLYPNRGLAGAMRSGLKKAIEGLKQNDIIAVCDADDSHNPFLLQRMLVQMQEGSDVVIASRYRSGARVYGLSKLRKLTSYLAGLTFRILAPIEGVRDYTCGFRTYRAGFLKQVQTYFGNRFIEEEGFACMAEILLKLSTLKPIIHEVPMILRYDRKEGISKMKISRTVHQTLSLIWDYHFSRRFKGNILSDFAKGFQ